MRAMAIFTSVSGCLVEGDTIYSDDNYADTDRIPSVPLRITHGFC